MSKSGSSAPKVLAVVVVIILILLVVAEFGTRMYITSQIKKDFASKSGSAESASVSYGSKPVLLGLATGKLSHIKVDIPQSLKISYPNGSSATPTVDGYPAATLQMDDYAIKSGIAGTMSVDAMLPTDYILAAAQGGLSDSQEKSGATNNLIQITGVNPNPSQGILTFEISGGLATLQMKPTIENDQIRMNVDSATLLGMNLPQSVVQALASQVQEASNVSASGLHPTKIEVTSRGMHVVEEGSDVNVKKLSDDADSLLGTKKSTQSSGTSAAAAALEPRRQLLPAAA